MVMIAIGRHRCSRTAALLSKPWLRLQLEPFVAGRFCASSPHVGTTYGSKLVRKARLLAAECETFRDAPKYTEHMVEEVETQDASSKTRDQIKRLFVELPGHVSMTAAYALHKQQKLEPTVRPPLDNETFEELFRDERRRFYLGRRMEVTRRRRKRRNHFLLNTGYKEEDPVYPATEEEFKDDWRVMSMVEDRWKAEYYEQVTKLAQDLAPESEPLATRTDRLSDVMKAAFRHHLSEQNRPVLTHELADYENPYMMKKSAIERILAERCVRNELDERCLPRLIDRQPSLVKLRAKARTPPEVLEPLAAFRGDGSMGTRWSFDARERLQQKISGATEAMNAIAAGNASDTGRAVTQIYAEEEAAASAGDVFTGAAGAPSFRPSAPRGTSGGLRFGQPEPELPFRTAELRYPTLQRVAHTLPQDEKWRAHTVRSMEVLERSKGWDYESKLRAANSMKEVYDNLQSSAYWTAKLDEKLPVNRVASNIKRKYARSEQYVKTFSKGFIKNKTFTRYRQSLTATAPLSKKKG